MPLKKSQLAPRRYDHDRAPRVFGYLRVHDTDLDPDAQEAALGTFDVLFIDATATFQHAQPGLNVLMAEAKRGDVVKVATIDRLGLTIADAIETVRLLAGMGIEVQFADHRLVVQPSSLERSTAEERDWLVLNHLARADEALRATTPGWSHTPGMSPFGFETCEDVPPALSIEQLASAEQQIELGIPRRKVAAAFKVSPAVLFLASHRHGPFANYPHRA